MSSPHAAIEDRAPPPAEGEEGLLEALRDADVSTLEALQLMALDFTTWPHRKGAEQMTAGGDKALAEVRALSNSFNRAARTERQIMILKEEAAGLRPTPQTRTCVANKNGTGASGLEASATRTPVQGHYGRGFRSERERRDWEEREERRKRQRDEG